MYRGMRTLSIILGFGLAACCLAGASAYADGATLVVNGVRVVTVKTSSGDYSPAKRAQTAADAVKLHGNGEVRVDGDGEFRILLGGNKVLTIGEREARAHGTTARRHARNVADRLEGALKEIPFTLASNQLQIPTDGSSSVRIAGDIGPRPELTVPPGAPFIALIHDGQIVVTATAAGEADVVLSDGSHTETLVVTVRGYAAEITQPQTAEVEGSPASRSAVVAAAARAARAALDPTPGASIQLQVLDVPQLMPSLSGLATVRVKATAPGLYPVETELTIKLRNVGAPEPSESELWYSNSPENIRSPARLYWGRLKPDMAVRLLYHHRNTTARPMVVKYVLANTSDEPARIALTLGDPLSQQDPTRAGYLAGQEFLPAWANSSATIVVVPPHSHVPIVWHRLAPTSTASGLATIRALEGSVGVLLLGDALWAMDALPEGRQYNDAGNVAHILPASSMASRPVNLAGKPMHVYAPPTKDVTERYEVGGRFGYVRIGAMPIARTDQPGQLSGNFGVLYRIKLELSNPTPNDQEIEVLYESSAGYGGAVFRLNGIVQSTPLLMPKQSYRILRTTLKAGESQTVFIDTLPLSGGSYPVTLTIKPVNVG